MPDHSDAINQLSITPAVLDALLADLPETSTTQPLDAGWGLKHVVAHLTITDRLGAIGRIRRIVQEDAPLMPEVDEDEALRESGLLATSTDELLAGFVGARNENVAWLQSLPPEALSRTGNHSAVGVLTGSDLLFHAAYHDTAHLQQLASMLGRRFEALRGSMRAYWGAVLASTFEPQT